MRNLSKHLYLFEQGSYIKKSGYNILVLKDGKTIVEEKIYDIAHISLFGHIQISTHAIGQLLHEGIGLAFLSLNGEFKGHLTSPRSKNIPMRLRQYECFTSIECRLALCLNFVSAKIKNALYMLSVHLKNHTELASALDEERRDLETQCEHVQQMIKEFSRALPLPNERKQSLLGIEGSAARAYFSGFAKCISPDSPLKMSGRTKHPPKDPVNALLSLGYSLLTKELTHFVESVGFEPYLGFNHSPVHGRPALALDIIEQLRHPCIDHLVLRVVNLNSFNADDFEEVDVAPPKAEDNKDTTAPEKACYLKKEAMKKFIALYEKWMRNPFSISLEPCLSTIWVRSAPNHVEHENPLDDFKFTLDWRTFIRYYIGALASFFTNKGEPINPPLIIMKRS